MRGQHSNVTDKLIAYHSWQDGGPGDDVVVVANFGIRADKPFTLQYRAVTFDGAVPTSLLNRLAAEWGH